jgi:hypothetical protein
MTDPQQCWSQVFGGSDEEQCCGEWVKTEQAEGSRKQAGNESKHASGPSRAGLLLLTAMLEADLAERMVVVLSRRKGIRGPFRGAERCKERQCHGQNSSDQDQCSNVARCKVTLHENDHQPR